MKSLRAVLSRTAVLALSLATLSIPTAAPVNAVQRASAAAPDSSADWAAIQGFLPGLSGTWTAPPTSPVTTGFPDGPLLGNGDLGVVVGGDTHTLTFHLSKNDLWTAGSGLDGAQPIAFGGLTLHAAPNGVSTGTNYSQTEDLLNAEVRSDLTINGAPIHARTYPSDTGDVLVTDVSNTGSGAVALALDVWGYNGSSSYPTTAGASGSTIWAGRSTQSGGAWVSRAAIATRVLGATVTTSTDSSRVSTAQFTIPAGQTVTIVSAVQGGKNATTQVADAQNAVAAIDANAVASISAAHLAWWKAYWLKSYVRLYDTAMEKYYYGAQYILGSASRTGSVGPGLYGAWVTTDNANWRGSFFLNYNDESVYYGAFSSNRSELADPYIQSIVDYEPTGAANIPNLPSNPNPPSYYKNAIPPSTRGYLYPVAIGPWASTSFALYQNQPSDASYAAVPMIYKYEYAPDNAYLSGTLYPYLVQLAGFWQDYLGAKGSDGKYHLMGADFEMDWAHDDSLDLAAVQLVMSSALRYSQILGVDSSRRAAWQDILSNLPAFKTDTYNGQTVYTSDYDTSFATMLANHQTVCNLEWIHPFDLLNLDSSSTQLQNAVNTLDAMDTWTEGNNFAKSFAIGARAGYPASALFAQMKSVTNQYMQPNLHVYQEGGGLESAGATDAINSMLLQSVNGTIRLFPDYPAGQRAHFSRLRAQGGFLVTADYDGTNASNVSLTADNGGGPVTVLDPWPSQVMTVTDATGAIVPTTVSGGRYTFTATAGATYTLTPGATATSGRQIATIATVAPNPAAPGQQVTVTGSGFGTSQGSGYVTFSDNGFNWGAPGDSATFAVNSWSNTAITFTVPTPSGPNGLFAVAPGTTGTVTVTTGAGTSNAGTLAIAPHPPGPITGVGSGKCVDIPGANNADGSQLQLYTCNSSVAQQWTVAGNGTVQAMGKCLDVRGGSSADFTPVQIYTCNGSAAQQWAYNSGQLQAFGKCLDASGAGTADGTQLILYTCTGGTNQQWKLS